jgi:hypothetical protein
VRNNIFINQVFIFSTKIPVLHVWKGTITISSKPDSITRIHCTHVVQFVVVVHYVISALNLIGKVYRSSHMVTTYRILYCLLDLFKRRSRGVHVIPTGVMVRL